MAVEGAGGGRTRIGASITSTSEQLPASSFSSQRCIYSTRLVCLDGRVCCCSDPVDGGEGELLRTVTAAAGGAWVTVAVAAPLNGRATRLALLPATQSAERDGHAGRLLVDSPACDMTGAAGGGGGGGGGGGAGEADAEEEEGAVTCAAMGRDMGTGGIQQRRTAAGEDELDERGGQQMRGDGLFVVVPEVEVLQAVG